MFLYQKLIKREDLQRNPKILYVFGDNMQRVGLGGQAGEMRGEPNAIGIPTKKAPSWSADAFFTKESIGDLEVIQAISDAILTLSDHLREGGTVVWPADGIGTGLAKLEESCPALFLWLEVCRKSFEEDYSQ